MTDEELVEFALASDADAPIGDDAVSMFEYLADQNPSILPDWYMPAPARSTRRGWQRAVILLIVAALVVIEAAGLCSTYGQIVFA